MKSKIPGKYIFCRDSYVFLTTHFITARKREWHIEEQLAYAKVQRQDSTWLEGWGGQSLAPG